MTSPQSSSSSGGSGSGSPFLAPENLCGQTLLQLVGEGHSILASIKSLSERIPPPFLVAAADKDGESSKDGSAKKASNATTTDQSNNNGGGFLNLFGKDERRTTSIPTSEILLDDESKRSSCDMQDAKKYAPFLFDFSYLHNPEEYEASLMSNIHTTSSNDASTNNNNSTEEVSITDLEREFAMNYRTTIQEYYNLFTSIYNYQSELNRFVSHLTKGYFIQYTVESVLLDTEGRALLCEAVWLYGVILIVLERLLPGPIRERLLIAHFRFNDDNGGDVSTIDHICKLIKGTGVHPPPSSNGVTFGQHVSHKYPMKEEELFARYPLPGDLVRNVVGCLISDDIYRHYSTSAFPHVDQRSTRLSRQASMLYVVLFFDPGVLREEGARLREIVDKYFYDNWVVHVYAGMTADLSSEWKRFTAARAALGNVLQVENVKRMHVQNAKLISQCMAELRAYLTMGILTDSFVLDNRFDLLNCLRKCNIAVRWRILHRRTTNAVYHGIVCARASEVTADPKLEGDFAVNDTHVVSLLLLSSQLEMQLKHIFTQLLEKKESIWINCRAKASGMMEDLAQYFEGDVTLARVSRHDGLIDWFTSMASEIRDIAYESGDHFTATGRKIQLCVQALEDVEQYDLVDRDVQVKAFLQESRDLLLQMARAVGINESIIDDINFISDISYGVESMKSYVKIIHSRISKDPSNVNLLQGFFLKLSNSLDGPVMRLKQLKSPEVKKVSGYYSSQLVAFVRNVLEIVPVSVFGILVQISDIFERRLQRMPLKVQGDTLGAYAQLGERYKLSMMAHEISIFADGVLSMDNSIIGGIEINPRKLLDEGLRKEMVRHVSELINNLLQFDFAADSETVASITKHQAAAMRSLSSLSRRLEGFQSALECIEDYVSIHGLKMWHEEFSRIINYNVEQEVNKYLLKKVLDADSEFQSEIVPIPRFPRTQNEPTCINFMGRLVSMLIKITDTQYTTFSIEKSGWFMNDGTEVCGLKTISLLRQAVGIYGLTGIDRLLCYRVLHELHRFVKFFRTNVTKQSVFLEQLRDELYPEWKTPTKAVSIYASASKKAEMLQLPMLTCFRRIGQAQLLRRMIRFELGRCSRVDAKMLHQSVSTLNTSILSSENTLDKNPAELKKFCDMSLAVGLGDPFETVFMSTDPLEGLPVLLLLCVIAYVPKLSYNAMFGSLSKTKTGYPIDGWPLVAGIATLLKQFHPSYSKSFLAYVGQFVRVSITTCFEKKQVKKDVVSQLTEDLRSVLVLVDQFCDISCIPKSALYEHIPQYLMEMNVSGPVLAAAKASGGSSSRRRPFKCASPHLDAKRCKKTAPEDHESAGNNYEKIKRESIIRRTTVAYGVAELLKRSAALKDDETKIDNFVVFVSNKVRSSRPWDDVRGVGMISSGKSLFMEEPSYLSALIEGEDNDGKIVGRCLEIEMTSSSEPKKLPGGAPLTSPWHDSLAGINALAAVAEESNRCHLFARQFYELFTNEPFPDGVIKPGAASTSKAEPPKKRARNRFDLPSRKKLMLSRAKGDFDRAEIPFQIPCIVRMQKLGLPASVCLMTQNLLGFALGGNQGSSDNAYQSLGVLCEDLHLLLLDPDRFLFDKNYRRNEGINLLYREGKLYGREKEETLITDAFCRVSRGKSEAFFIGGFSGSGKSMLVNSLRGTVNCVGGYSIKHKFNPISHEKPLSGVIAAFNQVCPMIRGKDRPMIAAALRMAFGVDFNLLIRLLPNASALFNDCSGSAFYAGDTMDARSVCFTLLRFVRVVSSPRHPIMLFLDDIQWADGTALDVVHAILSDTRGSCVFFVGTYRDNEVQVGHDLFDLVEKLEISNVPTTKVYLWGLNQEHVNSIISDALCLYPRVCRRLSTIVYQKTKGNPFFMLEFMKSLQSRGLLQYNFHQKRWVWNEDLIRAEVVTDNVLHLLTRKMNGLSNDLRLLLKVMACLGSSTNEAVIDHLSGSIEYYGVENGLEEALSDGFIEKDGEGSFEFAHDKVREAAYNLIPNIEKKQFHYNLGKVLHSICDGNDDIGDTIFLIANQINHGKQWILADKEQSIAIAELNMKAGTKALDGCDHKMAYSYLSAGLSLLPEDHWQTHYDLSLQLNYLMASTANSCCQYDEAYSFLRGILDNARCLDDQLPSYILLSQILQAHGKVNLVYDTCAVILKELGEEIPDTCTLSLAVTMVTETIKLYDEAGPDWLKGEKVDDKTFHNTLKFYNTIALASFYCKTYSIVVYLTCKAVQLTLRKGLCDHTALTLLQFTSVASRDENAASCYRIAKDGLSLRERFDLVAQVPELYSNYYGRIAWRFEPFQTGIDKFRQASDTGLSSGNADMGLHCLVNAIKFAIFSGTNLMSSLKEIDYYLHLLKTYKSELGTNFMLTYRETVSVLIDNGEATSIEEKAVVGDINDPRNKSREIFFYHATIRCYWKGHTERCRYYSEKCMTLLGQGGQPTAYMAKFYAGLNAIDCLKASKHIVRSRDMFRAAFDCLKQASINSEWNFTNKLRLLQAEQQTLSKNHWRSIELYEDSIKCAKKSGFIHEQGLALEKFGLYYKTLDGDKAMARKYLTQARECYEVWGSSMKVDFIQKHLDEIKPLEYEPSEGEGTAGSVQVGSSASSKDGAQACTENELKAQSG